MFEEGIFRHECEHEGCTKVVIYDDEPYCFTHSPDEGSSVKGYSARRKFRNAGLDFVEGPTPF